MPTPSALETVLKRDRFIVLAGLIGVSALAWGYLVYDARHMACLGMGMFTSQMSPWQRPDLVLLFGMWAIMMVAMMVPSVSPMVLLVASVNRQRCEQNRPFVPTSLFLLGYLVVWMGFSALATLAQWGLHDRAWLSPMMIVTRPWLGTALLLAAGVFQLTPLKRACLVHCRTPLSFLMTEWREGSWGTLVMGMRHGSYCVGCCWLLMGLLFVAGVMNLLWVAVISALVLAEKIVPAGFRLSLAIGLCLIGWGAWRVAEWLHA